MAVIVSAVLVLSVARAQEKSPAQQASPSQAHVEKLTAALRDDPSFKVRLQAAALLGRSASPSAVEPLIDALNRDPHYTVRAASATALVDLQDLSAIRHLLRRSALDENEFVRAEAARALATYDRKQAIPVVKVAYAGFGGPENDRVRLASVRYLFVADSGSEVDLLVERALGDTAEISNAAVNYVVALQPRHRSMEILANAVRNKQPTVRVGAVRALHQLNSKEATELIFEVYERDIEVEEVKDATRTALRERREYLDVDSIVRDAARGGEKHARGRALRLLGVVGGPKAERALLDALDDSDIYVRGSAVLAMEWLGSPSVVPSLKRLSADPGNQRIMHLVQNTLKRLRETLGSD